MSSSSAASPSALRALCDEVRIVQVTQPETLRGALEGTDLLVLALGKTYQKERVARWAVDVGATLDLFAKARRAGVGRIALVSVHGARADHPVAMMRMKAEAERGLEQTGLPWVVVRPTGFFSDLWGVGSCSKAASKILSCAGRTHGRGHP